jgi:hypothetical protein
VGKSPSDLHQALVELLRADLQFTLELVYAAAGLLPIASRFEVRELGTDARISTPDQTDRHLRPDLVLGLYVDGELYEVWLGELQLSLSSPKPLVISACRAALGLHHGVPAFSFVISPKPAIRDWMTRATIVATSDAPVIPEPRDFPLLAAEDARSRPHACLLRAFFHPDDLPALRLAVEAASILPQHDRHRLTAMLIEFTESPMSETLRDYLRSLDEEPEPDAWDRSRAGWQRAHREGVAEGRSLGVAEGRSLGVAEGRREALLDVLELRGLAVDEDTRARVLAQTDLATLERWYARAKQVDSIAALFAD